MHSQAPSSPAVPYQNLWELRKPGQPVSYVFGTMHIGDAAVYDQPDSVMLALAACGTLALEANLDSASYYLFEALFADGEEHSIQELAQLDALMKGKSRENVLEKVMKNPDWMKERLEELREARSDDEEETQTHMLFLDGFLNRTALQQGKRVVGLEDMREQVLLLMGGGLSSGLGDGGGISLRKLKALYLAGDVPEIGRRLAAGEMFGPEMKEVLLDKRNLVMAAGADSLMKLGSAFVAVGVAHLPGEEGVLALMKARGYSVRAVDCSLNTGVMRRTRAASYEGRLQRWHNVDEGYSIMVPVVTSRLDLKELEMPMYVGIDLADGWIYNVLTIESEATTDAERRAELARFKRAAGMENVEVLTLDGCPAYEVAGKDQSGDIRLLMVFHDGRATMLTATWGAGDMEPPAVQRYLRSFQRGKTVALGERELQWVRRGDLGWEARLPVGFSMRSKEKAGEDGGPSLATMHTGRMNSTAGTQFLELVTTQVGAGMPVLGHAQMNEIYGKVLERQGMEIVDEAPWKLGKFEGVRVRFREEDGRMGLSGWVLQGSRLHYLGVGGMPGSGGLDSLLACFESFRIPELRPSPLAHVHQEMDYRVSFPSPPVVVPNALGEDMLFVPVEMGDFQEGRDSVTGLSFGSGLIRFSEYMRVADLDSLVDSLMAPVNMRRVNVGMSGLSEPSIAGGHVWMGQNECLDGRTIQHFRVVLLGRTAYLLKAEADPDYTKSAEAYFASFGVTGPVAPFDFQSSKLAKILADLDSGDSTVADAAYMALWDYPMDTTEHGLALDWLRTHPEQDLLFGSPASNVLFMVLRHPRAGTLADMRLLYADTKMHPAMQMLLLSVLGNSEDSKMSEEAVRLFCSAPPQGLDALGRRDVGEALYSGILNADDAMGAFDLLAKYLDDPSWAPEVVFAADALAQVGHLEQVHLGLYRGKFQQLAREWMVERRLEPGPDAQPGQLSVDYEYLLVALSQAAPDETSFDLIRQLMGMGDAYLAESGVMTLLRASLPVDAKMVRALLDTPGHRWQLLDWMLRYGRMKGIPKKYFSAEMLALADLEDNYLMMEGVLPARIEPMGKYPLHDASGEGDLHVFKVGMPGAKAWTIGFAGPLPLKGAPEEMGFELTGGPGEAWPGDERGVRRAIRDWVDVVRGEEIE